jgi:hypothetical protein
MAFPLNQLVTLWKIGELDEGGGRDYLAPTEILVRWENKVSRFIHSDGTDRIGNCIIYTDSDLIGLEDKLFEGSLNALLSLSLGEAGRQGLADSLEISLEALNALLALANPIPGVDYAALVPFLAPSVRTCGSAGFSPSLGGNKKLYKIIGE